LDFFSNAQKAMPQGGMLTVNLKKEKDFLKLDFVDTGEKIPEELLPKTFDPLFFAPDLKKRLYPGLLLSGQIIQDHKGKIEILSHKDKGNIIRLKLPVIQ
jgi:signal transduction histidine kinase